MRTEGKLTQWNDDRGFGFVTPNDGGPAVFIHISEFPRDGDRPAIGERLSFETDFNKDGKPRAVNVRCPDRTPVQRLPRRAEDGPSLWGRLMSLVLVIVIGAAGYKAFGRYAGSYSAAPVAVETSTIRSAPASAPGSASAPAPVLPRFSCDGRTHCSQMRSCEEATFFLRNCPGTQMDGDGDGVPCERQWCG